MSTLLQTQTKAESIPSFVSARTGVIQRKCACGQHTIVGGECAECHQKREGVMQRAAMSSASVNAVPTIVHDVLSSSGQPLDARTRAFIEPRFGHDFSQVRVHADGKAAESARAVNALAYTVGRDVVFGAGQYEPGTSEGKRLLVHELTHVVQQDSRIKATTNDLILDIAGTSYEEEAEEIAEAMLAEKVLSRAGGSSMPTVLALNTPLMQRFVEPEHVLLGDTTQAALSRIMGMLSSAESLLRQGRSAWLELSLAQDRWKQFQGDPAVLRLLEQAVNANDAGHYETALQHLEKATPLVMAWLRTHPEAGGGPTTIIAGREHPEIAGLLAAGTTTLLTLRRSGVQLTYGEVLSLGDIYPSLEAMQNAPREELTNPQGKGILDLTRARLSGRREMNFDLAYQEATEWRERMRYGPLGQPLGVEGADVGGMSYLSLAQVNPEHFAGENERAWKQYHSDAVKIANAARNEQSRTIRGERVNLAYTANAFGDHFLTDAFAAGHLLAKVHYMKLAGEFWKIHKGEALDAFTAALLHDHWGEVVKLVAHRKISIPILGLPLAAITTLFFSGTVRSGIKDMILDMEREKPDVILNAAAKVAHDYYNEHGVEVQNNKGDHWLTFGDDNLNRSAVTWQLASLAVLRSRVDVTEMLRGTPPSDIFDAWNYTPIPPTRFDEIALAQAASLIMRPQNNPLADLFIRNVPIFERTQAFEAQERESAVEAQGPHVPGWNQLPPDAQRDLISRDYDETWFKEHDPETRLTVLNLYVKLSGLKLWEFVDTQSNTKVGVMEFLCSRIDTFKETLSNRGDFTSPEKSPEEWSSREMRAVGQLHFKHFKGWPETKVEAHIDQAGLLLSNKLWWLFPPVPLIQMARHGLSYESYKDVYGIRNLLLGQGWYRAPLIGVPPASEPKEKIPQAR